MSLKKKKIFSAINKGATVFQLFRFGWTQARSMKLILAFGTLAFVAVTVSGHICTNNDPSTCTHTCPDGETKACEHDVCTCAVKCSEVSDCPDCPVHTDPMGHTIHETKHCYDSACVCMPDHMMPPGGGPNGR